MTGATVGGWWTAAGPAMRGPTAARFGLALLSAAAAAGLSPWARSGTPVGLGLAELAACVLAWEGAMALSRRAASLWPRGTAGMTPPLRLALLVLAASVPATAAMMATFALVGERTASPGTIYGRSLALGLLIAFARRGLVSARGAAAAVPPLAPLPAPPEAGGAAAAFVRRHAPALARHRLLALQAEDHYLRLHTEGGTALVLMRLTDAAATLGSEAGWRPHRSFWLAAGVPAKVDRNGQSWKLTLPTGLAVPVSRANIGAMRDAGYREASSQPGPAPPLPASGGRAT